jgi:hypothetical protein
MYWTGTQFLSQLDAFPGGLAEGSVIDLADVCHETDAQNVFALRRRRGHAGSAIKHDQQEGKHSK